MSAIGRVQGSGVEIGSGPLRKSLELCFRSSAGNA